MNPPRNQLHDLVAAYVAGDAVPDEVAELTRLLERDPEARDYFLSYSDLHAGMSTDESLRPGQRPDSATIRPLPAAARQGRLARPWTIAAIAACLAGLIAAVAFISARQPAEETTDGGRAPQAVNVAVLTDTADAVWRSGDFVPRDVGEAVGRVSAELVSGRAEFQFDSGARVAIAGPAVLDFLSPKHVRLHRGRLTAVVPDPARGFTVEIEGARVVDLGTEFALNCDGKHHAEVHVYDGEIAVHHDSLPSSPPLKLRTNDTKRLETRQGHVADALFESERFLRIHENHRAPETGGDVRYLYRPPRSVLQGAFEHNRYILLFRERDLVTIDHAIEVNATAPGTYRSRRQPEDPPGTAVAVNVDDPAVESLGSLPPGTRLSSYFVHFDPVRGGGKGVHRSGTIRFKQPVLGIILTTRHLVPTDLTLGAAPTRYETTDYEVARNGLEPDDRVTLHDDGHTVTLKLGAGTSVDHLRILVAADRNDPSN